MKSSSSPSSDGSRLDNIFTSRKELTDLLDQSPVPMAMAGDSGRIEHLNREFIQAFGYTLADIPSTDDWYRHAYPDPAYRSRIREKWQQKLSTALKENRSIEPVKVDITCKDGAVKQVMISGSHINGRLIGYFQDLTAHPYAEEKLPTSEQRFKALFELHSAIMLLIDPVSGAIIDANRAAEKFYRYSRDQLISLNISAINTLPPEKIHSLRLQAAENASNIFIFDHRLANGEIRKVESHSSPIQIRGRTLLFSIISDIIERHRAQEERKTLEQSLYQAQKLESLGVLAGGIAHDYNNILTSILGSAELVRMKTPTDSPIYKHTQRIISSATRAAALTRQMLAYSGKGRFRNQPIDLNMQIDEVVQMGRATIGKNIELNLQKQKDLPKLVGDPSQISQIILSLLTNAVEAIGDQPGTITLRTDTAKYSAADLEPIRLDDQAQPGTFLCLEVSDSGCGMNEEVRKKLFDPFFTTKFTGRGLSLAAVHGIIRGHQGAIRVVSHPGQGSSLTVLLPAAPEDVPTNTSPSLSPESSREIKVLLVDDEESILATIGDIICSFGYQIVCARDGVEAVKIAQANSDIQLVILDMIMPRLDGVGAFDRLKQLRPELPIFIASGFTEDEMAKRFQNRTVDGFIQKPFKMAALQTLIQKHSVS